MTAPTDALRTGAQPDALDHDGGLFSRIVDLATDAIVTVDPEGTITFANPRMSEMLGYSVDELVGRKMHDLLAVGDAKERVADWSGRLSTNHRCEAILVHKDRSLVRTLVSSTPLQNDNDRGVSGGLAFITDITELREAEQALRASQGQLAAVLKHSPDIITVLNPDGSWRFTSGVSERLGHSSDAPPEESVFVRMHADDVAEAREAFEKIMVSGHGTESRQIVRMKAPDETWRVLDIVRQNLIDDPDINGIVVHARDITEKAEAEAALDTLERRSAVLAEYASDIVTISGTDGVLHYVSPSVKRLLGYSPDELVGTYGRALLHPDDFERVITTIFQQFVSHQVTNPIEYRLRHRNGTYRVFEGVVTNLLDEPSVQGLVTNTRDITDRCLAEARTRQLEDVLSQSDEIVVLSDNDGNIVWANEKARSSLGLTSLKHMTELTGSDSLERLRDEIMPFVREHGLWRGELTLVTKDGDEIPIVGTLQAHRDDTDVTLMSAIAHDITELKEIEHHLRYEATHDPLTGLLNRAMFHELGEQALARAARHATITGVLFLDLDGFKVVNDLHGHAVGDSALIEIAQRLRIGVRSGDIVTRLGGDEFCVLCERISDETEVRQLARRLVNIVSEPHTLGEQSVAVGVSIGIAVDETGSTTFAQLVRSADVALYQAKQAGRGQIVTFEEQPSVRGPGIPGRSERDQDGGSRSSSG